MLKTTPTPWRLEPTPDDPDFTHEILAGNLMGVASIYAGNGLSQQNAEAIVSAVNNTYGKSIRPEIIEELLNALMDLSDRCDKARRILQSPDSPSHGYWGMLDTERAKKAIEQSKL